MRAIFMALATLAFCSPAFAQDAGFEPYSAYVAPQGGLYVREQPRGDAPVLVTLWQGARVFVRERGQSYVRIDGYGVSGHAFVDERFLTLEAPAAVEPASLVTSASSSTASGSR